MNKILNNKKFIIIVGSLLLICLVIILINVLAGKDNYGNNSNNANNNSNDNVQNTVDDSTISQFLIGNYLISTSDVVGSVDPDGYVFLNNGKFAYYNGNFHISPEATNERLISYIGTWNITDNTLTLNVTSEEYAVGGTIVQGPPYDTLSNYTREVKNVDKTIKYTINGIVNDSDEYRTPHLYLANDNNEIRWYILGVEEDYLAIAKDLAENGYDENKDQTAKGFSNQVIDIQKYVALDKQGNNYNNYIIDLNKIYEDTKLKGLSILEEYNIAFNYKLNDYNIQLKLKDNDYAEYNYGVYVNNKYVYDDFRRRSNKIKVNMLGNYLIFSDDGGCTDIRCQNLLIVDKAGNITKLYDLESVAGMVLSTVDITDTGIVIGATRISHGPSIIYGDEYMLYYNDDCVSAQNKLPKDLIVMATYTYKFNNGVLNLTPEITNKITLDEYLKSEVSICN